MKFAASSFILLSFFSLGSNALMIPPGGRWDIIYPSANSDYVIALAQDPTQTLAARKGGLRMEPLPEGMSANDVQGDNGRRFRFPNGLARDGKPALHNMDKEYPAGTILTVMRGEDGPTLSYDSTGNIYTMGQYEQEVLAMRGPDGLVLQLGTDMNKKWVTVFGTTTTDARFAGLFKLIKTTSE